MDLVPQKRLNSGFTLVELLVVILILATLTAIALPLYLRSAVEAEVSACKGNMRSIANAIQANRVRSEDGTYWYGTVNESVVGIANELADLQSVPKCPGRGTLYTADWKGPKGKDGFRVRCSNPDHDFYWENGGFKG